MHGTYIPIQKYDSIKTSVLGHPTKIFKKIKGKLITDGVSTGEPQVQKK